MRVHLSRSHQHQPFGVNPGSALTGWEASIPFALARHAQALTFHVNANLTAVSLTKLQTMQTHAHAPIPFSMANAVRRAFNEHFLQRLLAHLAHGGRLAENSPEYETFCNYGLIQPIAA